MERKQSISLCMIVKNEERYLTGCLESAKAYVDEIVIVDTGSTDATLDIATQYGARIFFFSWVDDYSAARNESLRHATGDWVLQLDADERLVCPSDAPDHLHEIVKASNIDAYVALIRNQLGSREDVSPDFHRNIRLFRRIPGIHFEGEVHESVQPFLWSVHATTAHAPFHINHLGYDITQEGLDRKHREKLALLYKYVERDPENAYALYNFGQSLLAVEKKNEGKAALEKALSVQSINPTLKAMVLNTLARLHLSEDNLPDALLASEESLKVLPDQNTAILMKGIALYNDKDYAGALPHLLSAYQFLQTPLEKRARTAINHEYTILDDARLLQAVIRCYSRTGNHLQVISMAHRYLRDYKAHHEVLHTLGLSYLECRNYELAVHYLTQAESAGADPGALRLFLAYAHSQLQDLNAAVKCLNQSEEANSEDYERCMVVLLEIARDPTCSEYLQESLARKRAVLSRVPFEKLAALCSILAQRNDMESILHLLISIFPSREDAGDLLGAIVSNFLERDCIAEINHLLEKLTAHCPNQPAILDALAICHIKAGELRKAIEAYQSLDRLIPGRADILRKLAGLFSMIGDTENASVFLQRIRLEARTA